MSERLQLAGADFRTQIREAQMISYRQLQQTADQLIAVGEDPKKVRADFDADVRELRDQRLIPDMLPSILTCF